MRVFIVDYQHNGTGGTAVIKCSGTRALKDRLWMLSWARVTEIEPVAAWEWRKRQLEKVTPSKRLIIGNLSITRNTNDNDSIPSPA